MANEEREQYPHEGSSLISRATKNQNGGYVDLFKIYSVTYNVPFYFLPYDFKMTEGLSPNWNNQSVIGRMDPIMTFKNMTRTIQVGFKARQKLPDAQTPLYYTGDELLHSIDHLKKCLYPRYDSNQVMISPPLFRFQYKNLINAGEDNTFEIGPTNGVLGIITSFGANFQTDPNKIHFPTPSPAGTGTQNEFAYPKVFDISFTFTVMNEGLVATQQTGILDKQYFYKYNHDHKHTSWESQPETPDTNASNSSTSPTAQATAGAVLGGTRIMPFASGEV